MPKPQRLIPKASFAGSKVWTPLRGSRLGYILAEIKSDFGSRDNTLKNLVDKALAGHTLGNRDGNDVFTAIRDRLKLYAKLVPPAVPNVGATAGVNAENARRRTRAKDLVNAYNWHRMADAVQLDELVHNYVHSIAKDHIKPRALREAARRFSSKGVHKNNPEFFEAAKNSPSHTLGAFWTGLRNHVNKNMPGLGAKSSNYKDEMIDRSLRRLALVEEQNEDVKNTKSDYHQPRPSESGASDVHWRDYLSWLPASESTRTGSALGTGAKTNVEQYARIYASALPEKYGLMDKVKSLFGPKDNSPVIKGIRFHSHPNGKFDSDNANAAVQEIDALKMALEQTGVIPPQHNEESNQEYTNRANAKVGSYLPAVRAAAHADELGLGSWYNKTADRMRKVPEGPDIHEIEQAKRAGERPYLPAAGVGKFELANAVAPLVRKVATDRGELTPKFMVTNPVYPELPQEDEELDLANVPDEPEDELHKLPDEHKEAGAAELLHKMDAEKRGVFGSEKKPYEVVEDIHDDTPLDFDLPSIGKSPSIEEVEAHDPYANLKGILEKAKKHLKNRVGKAKAGQRKDVNQFIADSLHNRDSAETILANIQQKFNVKGTVADKLFENFKKLKNKPQPTNKKPATPQKKGPIKRRKFSREKYGRLPPEEARGFLEQALKEGTFNGGGSHPDHFFIDWLEDHDDPRAELVRRDLSFRQEPGTWSQSFDKHRNSLEESNPKIDPSVKAQRHVLDGTELHIKNSPHPAIKHVSWKLPDSHGTKGWNPVNYEAAFTDAEVRQFLDKLAESYPEIKGPKQYARKKKKSKKWVSSKIKKLIDEEGYDQKQAVAVALNMAGRSKYGRAPAECLKNFFDQSTENGGYDPNNNSDHVFADWLADHDDPREEIVRRDLKIRGGPDSFGNNYINFSHSIPDEKHAAYAEGNPLDSIPLKDGTTLEISKIGSRRNLYDVSWKHTQGETKNNNPSVGFIAPFSGEELNDLIDKLFEGKKHDYSRKDVLPGGVGDDTETEDVDPRQLQMGIEVEMEHTSSPEIAKEIALDHLTEDPNYYTKLKRMEASKHGRKDTHVIGTPFTPEDSIPPETLEIGMKWELKKTKNKKLARKKAVANLNQDVNYYNKKITSTSSKYARIGDRATYDALVNNAAETAEPTALGVLADHLQEHDQPGAKLARAGMHEAANGFNPFQHNSWFYDHYHSPLYLNSGTRPEMGWPYIGEDGKHAYGAVPWSEINVSPQIGRKFLANSPPAKLVVTHAASTPHLGSHLQYGVPVHSKDHLRELIEDLPSIQANTIWDLLSPHLPEKAEKYAAYRAPVDTINNGIVYPAGTFLPDPNKFSKKPAPKKKKKNKKRDRVKRILLKIFPSDGGC